MEEKEAIDFGEREEGFHVICGTSPKNGINSTIPEIMGCGNGRILDLSGLNSLLVSDLDYFVAHHEEIVEAAKKQIEKREHFREHPEELEEITKKERGIK